MNKSFSVYLDLVRFLAAVLVFIDHMVTYGFFSETTAFYIPQLGREAVIIFFVLSGYVIAFTTYERAPSWQQYFVARSSRIYSVALPILLLAFLLNFVYTYTTPSVDTNYQVEKSFIYIPFHMLFLGELWTLSEVPPWLGAYWSLSYEVWYYILFGTFFYTSGKVRFVSVTAVALMMGYKLWLLAPIWFAGAALYFLINKVIGQQGKLDVIAFIMTILVLVLFKYFSIDVQLRMLGKDIWPFHQLSLGSAERYLSDYFVTIIIIINFYFMAKISPKFNPQVANIIKGFASFTFTLYLLHVVTLSVWTTYFGVEEDSIWHLLGIVVFTFIATYCVGLFTEHKKQFFAQQSRTVLKLARLSK